MTGTTTPSNTTDEGKKGKISARGKVRTHSNTEKNPKGAGRPKGAKGSATILREALRTKSEGVILRHFPKIVETVCKQAEAGDMRAAKLIMDRILPTKRSVDENTGKGTGGITIVVQGADNPRLTALTGKKTEVIDVKPIEDKEADE